MKNSKNPSKTNRRSRPVTWQDIDELSKISLSIPATSKKQQESVSDALLKSAGYKEPTIWDLLSRLREAEKRLSAIEERLNRRPTLRDLIFALLKRPRTSAEPRQYQ